MTEIYLECFELALLLLTQYVDYNSSINTEKNVNSEFVACLLSSDYWLRLAELGSTVLSSVGIRSSLKISYFVSSMLITIFDRNKYMPTPNKLPIYF